MAWLSLANPSNKELPVICYCLPLYGLGGTQTTMTVLYWFTGLWCQWFTVKGFNSIISLELH